MDANQYLLRQHKKEVTSLFKNYLKILEDMKADHDFHYKKLYEVKLDSQKNTRRW